MAVPLQSVSSRLQILSSKLRRDRDIQMQIKNISKNARTAAESFKDALSKDGGKILSEKAFLLAGCPDETNVAKLQTALKAGKEALVASQKNVTRIQTEIDSISDICSTRVASYEFDLEDVLVKISSASAEIDNLCANISTYEEEAAVASLEAFDLQERTAIKRQAAEQTMHNATVTQYIGGLVGIVLAPFTGGQSLGMAHAAGDLKQSHLDATEEMEKNASRLRSEAEKYSREARKLKVKREELKKKKVKHESDMRNIQVGIDGVKEAANVLRQVSTFLLPTMNTIDSLLRAIQDMDATLDDVCQQRNSCEIIRSAFAIQSEVIFGGSEVYLRQTRERWKQLEGLLLRHGAVSVECPCRRDIY